MSLAQKRVATAKKQIESLRRAKVKKRCSRPHLKVCFCCGLVFSCALLRAMYCSKQCRSKMQSRQRERKYEQRECIGCGKVLDVRQCTDTTRCRECFKKQESEVAKRRPRHAGGYFMPGVSRASIENPVQWLRKDARDMY